MLLRNALCSGITQEKSELKAITTMTIQYLQRPHAPTLAYRYTPAAEEGKDLPCVVFCGGYRSDMEGSKAVFLERQCKEKGQAYIRLDYSGHGASDGVFEEGSIGIWTQDALDVLDHCAAEYDLGQVLLAGSSMGGWIAFLIASQRPDLICALVGIAAAPDFTKDIYHKHFTDAQRQVLKDDGVVWVPNDYSDEPYSITKILIDDGDKQSFLETGLTLNIPVRLVQGMMDTDVLPETAERIKEALTCPDFDIVYIDQGDHRLSKPDELAVIWQQIEMLSKVI